MIELQVLHLDGASTYYSIGPGEEFNCWAIKADGLVLWRPGPTIPRDRMHILPGSIRSVRVVFEQE